MGYVPNAKYLAHIPHQIPFNPFIRCSKCHIFCNMLQYHCKFATVQNQNGISFNNFLFSFLSPLSSLYSFLFSLTSVLSHRFSLYYKLLILIRHRWSIIADLSPVAFCIVIANPSEHRHRHRHHHRRTESTWASMLRWDQSTLRWGWSVRHDRGHRRWDEVRSWSWVAGASGFWLPVQVESWLWVGGASSFVALGWRC